MGNSNLHKAKSVKNDEFYTRYEDIEKEVSLYSQSFSGKVVYCNCDDWRVSNFYKWFKDNFDRLKLKSLICTGFSFEGHGTACIFDGKSEDSFELEGNGDFRSNECRECLAQADVVVTNPPFSLFREYVDQLMKFDKRFLIIGSLNAITYKGFFPFIRDNLVWLGCNAVKVFNDSMKNDYVFGNIYWYTNMENHIRNCEIKLVNRFDESLFPKYDNYNAVEVSRVCDIPSDYIGVMGVPITFLLKYNPNQFVIIGVTASWCEDDDMKLVKTDSAHRHGPFLNGQELYKRVLICKI